MGLIGRIEDRLNELLWKQIWDACLILYVRAGTSTVPPVSP